jgi:hypothetical protein
VFNAANPADNEIIAEAQRKAREGEALTGTDLDALIGAGTGTVQDLIDRGVTASGDTKNSLLDEIIKYYALASGGLDLLGGALGGRGSSGAGTPYTSQLGPMPTFGRSAFTPFTGDYETYGFGPEWNFFGGTPPPTPSGPPAGILPPAANPNFRLV